jgi:hypothetical protein
MTNFLLLVFVSVIAGFLISYVLKTRKRRQEKKRWADSIGSVSVSYSEHDDQWHGGHSGNEHERAIQVAREKYGTAVDIVLADTKVDRHIHFGDRTDTSGHSKSSVAKHKRRLKAIMTAEA